MYLRDWDSLPTPEALRKSNQCQPQPTNLGSGWRHSTRAFRKFAEPRSCLGSRFETVFRITEVIGDLAFCPHSGECHTARFLQMAVRASITTKSRADSVRHG